MDDLSQLTALNKKWLKYLIDNYEAEGRALHTALNSVESRLPQSAVRKLRYIATIRNTATHEDVKLATRERRNLEKTDRALDAIFTSCRKRNKVVRRRPGFHNARSQNDAYRNERRFSFASEALFWLTISAIVAGYCYWRFYANASFY